MEDDKKRTLQMNFRISPREKIKIESLKKRHPKLEGIPTGTLCRVIALYAAECSDLTFKKMVVEGYREIMRQGLAEADNELAALDAEENKNGDEEAKK